MVYFDKEFYINKYYSEQNIENKVLCDNYINNVYNRLPNFFVYLVKNFKLLTNMKYQY